MIGPRNRRRLAIGAGIAAVIIAAAAAVLLTRSATHSGHASTPPTPQSGQARSTLDYRCVPIPDGSCQVRYGRVIEGKFVAIIDGMTKSQMQHLFGKPAAKRGRCWQYFLPVNDYLASQHVVEDVLSVCFYEGRFSDKSESLYVRRHGKLVVRHLRP